MNFINILFLVPLFIVGIISSYTDIKYGKIYNRLILWALIYGLGLICILFIYNALFLYQFENLVYLSLVLLNALLSLITSYVLWHNRLWSAGDAKLFTIYALLLPLSFYDNYYINYFPSFNLLINLFIPVLIILSFFTIKDLFCFNKNWKVIKKNIFSFVSLSMKADFIINKIKNFFILFYDFIFFMIIFQTILFALALIIDPAPSIHPLLFLFIMLFVIKAFNTLKAKTRYLQYIVYIISISHLLYLIIQLNFVAVLDIIRMAFIFMIFINIIRQIIALYIDRKETFFVKLEDLKIGDLVRDTDLNQIVNLLNEDDREVFSLINSEGLTEAQLLCIKNKITKSPIEYIRIDKTFPFAPYMFLAVIISILTSSSILAVLQNLF